MSDARDDETQGIPQDVRTGPMMEHDRVRRVLQAHLDRALRSEEAAEADGKTAAQHTHVWAIVTIATIATDLGLKLDLPESTP